MLHFPQKAKFPSPQNVPSGMFSLDSPAAHLYSSHCGVSPVSNQSVSGNLHFSECLYSFIFSLICSQNFPPDFSTAIVRRVSHLFQPPRLSVPRFLQP